MAEVEAAFLLVRLDGSGVAVSSESTARLGKGTREGRGGITCQETLRRRQEK